MTWSLSQKCLGEFLGTFGLVVSVTGAAIFTFGLGADTNGRVLLIAMALGFGVLGMVYAFGDVSGAHFNPAVTIGMWASGRMKTGEVVPYIVSQLLGGIVAVAAMAGVAYGSSVAWANAQTISLASQGYSGNGSGYLFSAGSVFLLEVVFTFFLVLVILYATRSDGFAKNLAPVGIALTLLMTNLVAIPVDGASVNPARSFAPALLSAMFWSSDRWAITQDWIFWVAPIIGGLLAAGVTRMLRE
ncbi:MAG: aquaporin [Thermoplasmata archaeon]|nr:aquaporin [Thermoplasmata archaeon]